MLLLLLVAHRDKDAEGEGLIRLIQTHIVTAPPAHRVDGGPQHGHAWTAPLPNNRRLHGLPAVLARAVPLVEAQIAGPTATPDGVELPSDGNQTQPSTTDCQWGTLAPAL